MGILKFFQKIEKYPRNIMKIFWMTVFVRLMKSPSLYLKATIEMQVYSHKPHSDLFISKYSLAHMCPSCIMHRSRCRILVTIGTEYKHGLLSPMYLTCQFSNTEFYEYFMEPRSPSFFRALCELWHQISASPTLYRNYGQLLHFSVRYQQSFNVQNHFCCVKISWGRRNSTSCVDVIIV